MYIYATKKNREEVNKGGFFVYLCDKEEKNIEGEGVALYVYETKKNREEGKRGDCFVYLCDKEGKRGSEGF